MKEIHHFYAVGVSYKSADIDLRGQFSLNDSQQHALFLDAQVRGVKDLLIINTCNRTEIYAWSKDAKSLIDLLCSHSGATHDLF